MPASSPNINSSTYWSVTNVATYAPLPPQVVAPELAAPPALAPTREEQPFQDFEVRLATYSNSPPGELAIYTKYGDDSNWDPFPWADISPNNLRRLAAALNNYLVRQAHVGS